MPSRRIGRIRMWTCRRRGRGRCGCCCGGSGGAAVRRGVPAVRLLDADHQPMHVDGADAEVMAAREAILAETGAVEMAWCFGFPYADFAGVRAGVAAYRGDAGDGGAAADALSWRSWSAGGGVSFRDPGCGRGGGGGACGKAGPGGPVVIADTQDNPGGGGHGDTTGLLAELVRQGAEGAVMCLINDAESAAACHAAGEGAALSLSLGRQVGRGAVGRAGAGAAADGRAVHADRADGGGQSGQSRAVRADRDASRAFG